MSTHEEDLRRDAYLRGGASLAMWLFAMAAFLMGLIQVRHLIGVSASVAYLVLLGFPVVVLARRVTAPRAYAVYAVVICVAEVLGYTAVIYSLGGVEASYLVPIYVTYVSYMGVVEHRESPYVSAAICAVFFDLMVVFQNLGILPGLKAYPGFTLPLANQIVISAVVSLFLFIAAYISASASAAIKRMRRLLSEQNAELERRVEERTEALTREIEERKRAQEQISASLREKEILIKEVHHRVKNNLQVVSSLLSLQSSFVQNPRTREMFMESESRVRSMALIHEMLYQGRGLERVDVPQYLNGLLSALSRSYGARPEVISFAVHAQGVSLNVDKAIPCGLIVTELVSNALKHAFPGGRKGLITVALSPEEPGPAAQPPSGDGQHMRLTVSDDGIGLSGNLDFRNTETLGMQLVNTLALQLGGTIEVSSRNGTTFTVRFPTLPEAGAPEAAGGVTSP